jgi:predicted Zn-dependent protease
MNQQRIDQLKKLIHEEPEDPFYVYALALELVNTDSAEAKNLMETIIKDHPTYLPTYYQLANLYSESDQLQKAEKILQKGIALAKEQRNSKALQELQNLLLTNSLE